MRLKSSIGLLCSCSDKLLTHSSLLAPSSIGRAVGFDPTGLWFDPTEASSNDI